MTDTRTDEPVRKAKPKPGAWAPTADARSLPLAFVPTTDERVVRSLDLISREAELLDHKNYQDWQELYTETGHYVIPIDPDAVDFDNTLNMVYDDARMRALRVTRMTEGYAIAAVDSATTVRTTGRVVPGVVTDESVELRLSQTLIAYKRGNHDIWCANVDFTIELGSTPDQDRIARKIVRLIDGKDEVPAAGFLL
jgi:3-phenylpropionate/cinnamic acid dioxygenase small subunit